MQLRPTGMSIGFKFMIAIVLASCLVGIGMGVRSYDIFRESFQSSLISNGQKFLDQISRVGAAYLHETRHWDKAIEEIEATVETLESDTEQDHGEEINELRRRGNEYWIRKKELIDKYRDLLPSAEVGGDIQTCTIKFASERERLVDLGRGDTRPFRSGATIFAEDDTKVTHGERDGKAIVSFERDLVLAAEPATETEPERPGIPTKLYLQLSAASIDAATDRIKYAVILTVLFAVVVGSAMALLLASRITAPIRHLVEDIHQVAQGNLEHRTQVESHDEIGVMARAVDTMTQGLRAARDAEIEHRARERELAIAGEIQDNLLPKQIPQIPGYDMAEFYQASKEVGGDYYDFIRLDEDRIAMVVADVSGKGVPGALVMTMVRALLRMEATHSSSTARILSRTNRIVHNDIKRGMFVTAMFVVLDIPTRRLQISSAGHNPMLLYRAATGACQEVNPGGIALGFDPGPIFDRTIEEEDIQLEPGDRIVLYTDGVSEAMSPGREEYGDERLRKLIKRAAKISSASFVGHLVKEIQEHQAEGPQHDDITIVTVKVT